MYIYIIYIYTYILLLTVKGITIDSALSSSVHARMVRATWCPVMAAGMELVAQDTHVGEGVTDFSGWSCPVTGGTLACSLLPA